MNEITNNYCISIYLDTRRAKKNGKFPVKLRVFTSLPRTQKLYPTKFEFSVDEFDKVWIKQSKAYREDRLSLQAIELKANEVAKSLKPFIHADFKKVLFGVSAQDVYSLQHYYDKAIEEYKLNEQIGTASNYHSSLESLKKYDKRANLNLFSITKEWLEGYQRNMLKDDKSMTTVGIYLRPLRAILNKAIKEGVVDKEHYPFGEGKYIIPEPKGVKKTLSKEQLKALFEGKPLNDQQEKAKAFWFFSYACNGINFKDIVNLKYKNVEGEYLTFVRSKTANTNKAKKPVVVYLNDYLTAVIELYGNKDNKPSNLIFPVLNDTHEPLEKKRKLQNFIRFVNQHFLNYAKSVGIEEKISSYWARHCFATHAIQNGASMEYVSEALSHSNMNTTKSYFTGFSSEKKKEVSNGLMNF